MATYALYALAGLAAFHGIYNQKLRPIVDGDPIGDHHEDRLPATQARDLAAGEPPSFNPQDAWQIDTQYDQLRDVPDPVYSAIDEDAHKWSNDGGVQRAHGASLYPTYLLNPTTYMPGDVLGGQIYSGAFYA